MVGTGRDAYFGGNDIFAEVGVDDLGKPFPNAQTFEKGLPALSDNRWTFEISGHTWMGRFISSFYYFKKRHV